MTAPRRRAGLGATVVPRQAAEARRSRAGDAAAALHAARHASGPAPGSTQLIATAFPEAGSSARRSDTSPTPLRLNQVQVLGSHNSYHVAPTVAPYTGRRGVAVHATTRCDVQFESEGIRQIELDVYVDPTGIRVLHVPDVDFGTTCSRCVDCLQADQGVVRRAPEAHADHDPDRAQRHGLRAARRRSCRGTDPRWTSSTPRSARCSARSDVLTPDDVRGHRATLAEAITKDGWPTIDSRAGPGDVHDGQRGLVPRHLHRRATRRSRTG